MKRMLQIALGVVTSIGGFLETGNIATASQAGAAYGYGLLWAFILGTICIIFLVEMSGRFAIASHYTIMDGIRHRFGSNVFLLTLAISILVNLMVLTAEIGGVSLALQFVTGLGCQWWALPATLAVWLLLWRGTFGLIENGVSLLGLLAICFVVALFVMDTPWYQVTTQMVPTSSIRDPLHYGFIATSILGAVISPYLFFFYSSGAIEEAWDKSYFAPNRAIATLGMSFGAVISMAILILAAMIFPAKGIENVEGYEQIAMILLPAFGKWGFYLFAVSLLITCFGAALEVSLAQAYVVAQGFGWNWSENAKPQDNPAFSLVYTGSLMIAVIPILAGIDPLQMTIFSMAITAVSLPFGAVPFLVLMNDPAYVGEHRNGWIANVAVVLIIAMAFILSIITIPLQIFGG
ncbi:Nramp family divalent metal transporter (plasmid) [Rhizobium sp. CB3090]|uniref:Nramp family divalent metal transporter n=1 Tax=Rhizobium sp. CB3090 TaxID=3039156 RepID=UPI0024B17F8A|nr:Nramp family divalent metal transporter [Rhizobium sp. CB3090]WFU11688.1 Nramp family divalent metal transporter [Rhizobium sp. CB3090]